MKTDIIFCMFIFIHFEKNLRVLANLQDDIARKLKEENSTTLSRKRRYLVFPEGSSFQVVYDLTIPAEAIEGNVFMFGNTASMAWELPSDASFFDQIKMKNGEGKEEKVETTTMEPMPDHSDVPDYYDHGWQPPLAWDYSAPPDPPSKSQDNNDRSSIMYYTNNFDRYQPQRFLQNYGYANNRYSGDYGFNSYNRNPSQFWSRGSFGRSLLHPLPTDKNFTQNPQINRTVAHHIHRRSRRQLYTRVEKLFSALSKDGKACILKAICQVNQLPSRKGTMWEEIIKAMFKARHDKYSDQDHYDRAANISHDCEKMYPSCEGHVLSNLFKNRIRNL